MALERPSSRMHLANTPASAPPLRWGQTPTLAPAWPLLCTLLSRLSPVPARPHPPTTHVIRPGMGGPTWPRVGGSPPDATSVPKIRSSMSRGGGGGQHDSSRSPGRFAGADRDGARSTPAGSPQPTPASHRSSRCPRRLRAVMGVGGKSDARVVIRGLSLRGTSGHQEGTVTPGPGGGSPLARREYHGDRPSGASFIPGRRGPRVARRTGKRSGSHF